MLKHRGLISLKAELLKLLEQKSVLLNSIKEVRESIKRYHQDMRTPAQKASLKKARLALNAKTENSKKEKQPSKK